MKLNEEDLRERRNPRLKAFDYSTPGAYFITVCAASYLNRFGAVREGNVELSRTGRLVAELWQEQPNHYSGLKLDLWVLMPNHLHAVVWLTGAVKDSEKTSLIRVLQTFKGLSTVAVNKLQHTPGRKLWQRSFFDHVIRDEAGLNKLREYILENPANWHLRRMSEHNVTSEHIAKWYANLQVQVEAGPSVARLLRWEGNGLSVALPLRGERDGPSVARPLRADVEIAGGGEVQMMEGSAEG